jgi:hypothetical protein
MTSVMYDSTNPLVLPRDADVAGYYNGEFAWGQAEFDLFARYIKISVMAGMPGAAQFARVLDVETFDATPDDVVPFLNRRIMAGYSNGTIYCNRSTLPAVLERIHAAKGLRLGWKTHRSDKGNCRLWVADWTGEPHELPDMTGVWAVQYANDVAADRDDSEVFGPADFSRP